MSVVDFQVAVLDRSRDVPVVVDFWAAWCGPCRSLGPHIEALAAQAAGRWELVKLDVDAQPELAQRYGVQGIPAVKMFHRGEVVADFVGALPREEIERWLEANLPDESMDALAALAGSWVERGSALIPELEAFVEAHPDSAAGRLRLAQASMARDPARARELLLDVEEDPTLAEPAADVRTLLDLIEHREEAPGQAAGALAAARSGLEADEFDAALESLVDAVIADRGHADELGRRAAVALYRLIGHDHELARKHQRRLSMALHA